MEVTARPVTAGDLAVVADLAAIAIEELRPHRGGEIWYRQSARHEPVEASLADDLADEGVHTVAGCIDDVIVGYGVIRREAVREATLGVASDLYVLDGARGVGVGEAIMNAMIDWARAEGCVGVDSVALPGDRATKNFFESFGLKARAIVVHRSLTEEA